MSWEIKPGLGLDELRFGVSRDEVEAYLGAPEQIDEYEIDDSKTVAWYYWSQDISGHFDESEDYRLTTLHVEYPRVTLNRQQFISVSEAEMLSILLFMELGEVTIDDDYCRSIKVEDLRLTFYIEEGRVASVQWSPLLDDNGDYIWPEATSSG